MWWDLAGDDSQQRHSRRTLGMQNMHENRAFVPTSSRSPSRVDMTVSRFFDVLQGNAFCERYYICC